MRCKKQTVAVAAALFAALAMPVRRAAQEDQKQRKEHVRYILIDIGTLGGPESNLSGPGAQILNNRGAFAGLANTSTSNPNPNCFIPFNEPDCFVEHPFQWENGRLTELAVLPGGINSQTDWITASGLIVGWSENGLIDPLTGLPEGRAVLWTRHGKIIDLGTVPGGTESLATAANSQGQVVGFSNNDVADPFSIAGFPTQTRAFVWQNEVMQDLGTLGGPDAMALYVNERGQVAGNAFTNWTADPDTGTPIVHPFVWEDGRMIDLGGFGGTLGFANALNNRGQVVGQSYLQGNQTVHPFLWQDGILNDLGTLGGSDGIATSINDTGTVVGSSNLPGDEVFHAFLWMHGAMTHLGSLDNDPCSFPWSINARRQVVGTSNGCRDPNRPFLWENGGPMVNLNDLIVPGSEINMRFPMQINDRGEIGGFGRLPNGDFRAVLLIPCDGDQAWHHPDGRQCDAVERNAPAVSKDNLSPVIQPVSKEIQARLLREMLEKLRTQPGRYRGAGARRQR